jgi:hypothetical protein
MRGAGAFALLAALAPAGGAVRRWQALAVVLLAAAILLVGGAGWKGRSAGPRRVVAATAKAGPAAEEWPVLPGIGAAGLGWESKSWPANGAAPATGRGPFGVPAPRPGEGGGRLALPGLLASLLYASYTSALLVGNQASAAQPGEAFWLAPGVVGFLLLVMVGAIGRSDVARDAPLPMVAVAAAGGPQWAGAYAALLGLAAANAAVANARVLGEAWSPWSRGLFRARVAVTASAWMVACLGFSRLVGVVYPLLGWAWLPALLWLAVRPSRSGAGPAGPDVGGACSGRGQAV